ncbi:MAG TPA: BON domain-containing protein [Candidatus Limnocylindrales bacterium]|nr:BON domain-containing protein [Candidatus Limnocylindrales bacterium]
MSDDEISRASEAPRETPLAGPDPEPEDKRRELTGDEPEGDQVAWLGRDEVDERQAELTHTELYMGELEAGTRERGTGVEDLTELGMRDGETANPAVAAEEGMTWVPPIDPPTAVSADDPQGAQIAAGFGDSAVSEPYDHDHGTTGLADEDELSARVREALRADAATSRYADDLAIGTRGGTVAVRGMVDDVDDSDNVVEVASRVTGVAEVIDELDVRALEDR